MLRLFCDREAFFDSLPVFLAYFPIGIIWGLLWEQTGYESFYAVLYSFFIYGGVVQFLCLPFLKDGGSLLILLITVAPAAFRNTLYNIVALDLLPKQWVWRIYTSATLVDATFGILVAKEKETARRLSYIVTLSTLIHWWWILGSFVGVYLGSWIPNELSAFEFAVPSLLMALVVDQWLKVKTILPLFIALFAIAISLAFFADTAMLVALCIVTVALIIMYRNEAKR